MASCGSYWKGRTSDPVGLRLEEVLQEKNINQSELARRVGLTAETVKKLKAGKHDGRVSTVVAICDYLGIRMDWLIRGYGEKWM